MKFIKVIDRDSRGDPILIAADWIAWVGRCDTKPKPYLANITLKNNDVIDTDSSVEEIEEMLK